MHHELLQSFWGLVGTLVLMSVCIPRRANNLYEFCRGASRTFVFAHPSICPRTMGLSKDGNGMLTRPNDLHFRLRSEARANPFFLSGKRLNIVLNMCTLYLPSNHQRHRHGVLAWWFKKTLPRCSLKILQFLFLPKTSCAYISGPTGPELGPASPCPEACISIRLRHHLFHASSFS